jgi:hypothetical protein
MQLPFHGPSPDVEFSEVAEDFAGLHRTMIRGASGSTKQPGDSVIKLKVEYEVQKKIDEVVREIEQEVNDLNRKGLDHYSKAKARFKDSPDVAAFCKYYDCLLAGKEPETE